MEFDESDDDWEAIVDDEDHVDSKKPEQYHFRDNKLAEYNIDDSENSMPP